MTLKRTLYFGNPFHLSLRRRQLLFCAKDGSLDDSCPVEDLGVLVLDHPQLSLTMPLMLELAENNVAVVLCDGSHLPAAQVFSMRGHSLQQKYQAEQMAASLPLKKRLWQQTVRAKISNQQALLEQSGRNSGPLSRYAANVKSGDSGNREAAASQYYWPCLWGKGFVRKTHKDMPREASDAQWLDVNLLLNYGYSVLRAAVARALTGSGLLLGCGIQHHNQYNPYTLADDIMEPYRPYVDSAVLELHKVLDCVGPEAGKQAKQSLLSLLACDVPISRVKRPLLNALSITSASLQRCYSGEARQIEYPSMKSGGTTAKKRDDRARPNV